VFLPNFLVIVASTNQEAALGALFPNILPVHKHRKSSVSEKYLEVTWTLWKQILHQPQILFKAETVKYYYSSLVKTRRRKVGFGNAVCL